MFARIRTPLAYARTVPVLVSLLGGPSVAAGQPPPGATPTVGQSVSAELTDGYVVKPSEITLPGDVPLGQYRRVMQPFPNWTLICDENLKQKQKVCNISQSIVDGRGNTALSWSLAAAEDGRPFFILRVPAGVGKDGSVQMMLADKGAEVSIPVSGCDTRVCVAYQQVGPRLRAAVSKGGPVVVSYKAAAQSGATITITFSAPLKGLNEALAAI